MEHTGNPSPEAEIAALRSELNVVKEQLAELRQFLHIGTRDDGSKFLARVTCSYLDVCNPAKRDDTRIWIGAGDDAAIGIWGRDRRPRVFLHVDDEDRGAITISGASEEKAVQLWADPDDHGQLWVFSPEGKPRAGMKSMGSGGVVLAAGENGSPRAVIASLDDRGEVAVLVPGQICAKLTTGDEGGFIGCYGRNGKTPGVAIAAKKAGDGFIVVSNESGQPGVTLAAAAATGLVNVQSGPLSLDESAARSVRIFSHDAGCGVLLHNGEGINVAELITTADGANIGVQTPAGSPVASISSSGDQGRLVIAEPGTKSLVTIATNASGGSFLARSRDGKRASTLQFADGGGALSFLSDAEQQIAAITLGFNDSLHSTLQLHGGTEGSPANVSIFTHEHGGSVVVHGVDGTRLAGLSAGPDGGTAAVFSELGIERAMLHTIDDGGTVSLKWGGTTGLFACATERGGIFTALDAEGKPRASLPEPDEIEDPEEADDET